MLTARDADAIPAERTASARGAAAAPPVGSADWGGWFRAGLEEAVLASERQRAGILAFFFFVMWVGHLGLLVLPSPMTPAFRAAFLRARPLWFTFYSGVALYEAGQWALAGWLLRTGRRPPRWWRFASVAVEVSLPTLITLVAARVLDPVEALVLPSILFYAVLVLLTTLYLDWRLSLFAGALAGSEFLAMAGVFVLRPHRRDLPDSLTDFSMHTGRALLLLLSGMTAAFVSARLRRQFADAVRSVAERNRAVSIFGQHVSPQVAERLLAQSAGNAPELREVCVMFLDIRGFTRFADGRSPDAVMGYLNDLFGPLIETVNAHHGIINKFLGDGFMSVFGAPAAPADRRDAPGESSRDAVRAAARMLAQVEQLAAEGVVPATTVGIGLHAGRAVTGNVGSASRKEYTVIGDVVNLASRVESLNKQFGSRLLVTRAVYDALSEEDVRSLNPTALGPVEVRGQHEPVELYRLA